MNERTTKFKINDNVKVDCSRKKCFGHKCSTKNQNGTISRVIVPLVESSEPEYLVFFGPEIGCLGCYFKENELKHVNNE